jgi:hypothetical protein
MSRSDPDQIIYPIAKTNSPKSCVTIITSIHVATSVCVTDMAMAKQSFFASGRTALHMPLRKKVKGVSII